MKRGFTLAEVLVTLVIITFGMAALLMALSSALGVSGNVEEEETAMDIANAAMERLRGTSYTGLQNYTVDAGTLFSGMTGYTVTVTTTKPADPARVNVTVSWLGKGGTSHVDLTWLAADY